MLKKINFIFSVFVSFIMLFFFTNVINGMKTSAALYKGTYEIHMEYSSDMDFDSYINDLYETSIKEDMSISQYSFTSVNQLTILATNPNVNKQWDFSEKNILSRETPEIHVSNSKKTKYQLNLPNNFLNIKIYPFSYVENIGLSDVLYVQGNLNKLFPVLEKYGSPSISDVNRSDTFQIDMNSILVIFYLTLFMIITLLLLAFSKMKEISLKKLFGYTFFDSIKDFMKDLDLLLYSLIMTFGLSVFLSLDDNNGNFILAFLLCSLFHLLNGLLFISVIFSIYHLSNIKNHLKNSRPIRFNLCVLNICLWLSTLLLLFASIKVVGVLADPEDDSLKYWEKTTNLYKTNITNQLNRNDDAEENNYLKKASSFIYKIREDYQSFIMVPYTYATIQENKKEQFIGKKVYPKFEDYITHPHGAGICIDLNYLTYNPISFENDSDLQKINANPLTTYILVPKKYKKYADRIEEDYLDDLKFRLEDSPPQTPYKTINLNELKIKLIYVDNDQKYFTYNTLYGKAKDSYTVIDPIVRVINPEITESLFWGNILTSDGGLYFDLENTSNNSFFTQLKPYIKETGLESTVNFSYSVFQEAGKFLAQKEANKYNAYIQYFLIVGLFVIINFQVIFVNFTLNSKKIALKKIFGYSQINQIIDLCILPLAIESLTIVGFHSSYLQNTYLDSVYTILLLFLINIVTSMLIYKRNSVNHFKENVV